MAAPALLEVHDRAGSDLQRLALSAMEDGSATGEVAERIRGHGKGCCSWGPAADAHFHRAVRAPVQHKANDLCVGVAEEKALVLTRDVLLPLRGGMKMRSRGSSIESHTYAGIAAFP